MPGGRRCLSVTSQSAAPQGADWDHQLPTTKRHGKTSGSAHPPCPVDVLTGHRLNRQTRLRKTKGECLLFLFLLCPFGVSFSPIRGFLVLL